MSIHIVVIGDSNVSGATSEASGTVTTFGWFTALLVLIDNSIITFLGFAANQLKRDRIVFCNFVFEKVVTILDVNRFKNLLNVFVFSIESDPNIDLPIF